MMEPIGIVTLIIGLICCRLQAPSAVAFLLIATLFGSAAALILGSINIPPAHFLLFFVVLNVFSNPRYMIRVFSSLRVSNPNFWFVCLILYGSASAILMPRLFAGATQIMPVGASEYEPTGSTVPLGPVSGNSTQTIYLVANCCALLISSAVSSTKNGIHTLGNAFLLFCALNIFFAAIDVATYSTGTQFLMSFMRNAQYTFHFEEEMNGFKRIAGSFSEASAFARTSVAAFSFCGTLWLCARQPTATGILTGLSFAVLLLSTSSTGLVSALPILILLYQTALSRCGTRFGGNQSSAVVIAAPLIVVLLLLFLLLTPGYRIAVAGYLDNLVFDKSVSQSGIERSSWNAAAIENFFETWGVGVGLGSAKASSFILALISNLGVLGALFYAVFFFMMLYSSTIPPRSFESDISLAARNACIALLIADAIAGTLVDQGLMFYMMVGVAAPAARAFGENQNNNAASSVL